MDKTRFTRRKFLNNSLLASAILAAPSALAATQPREVPWVPGFADLPSVPDDVRFFTPEEAVAVSSMAARLIPTDESGPGATEAGVTEFIDRQLAGFYGRGQRWYMQGPFREGTEEQGYQSAIPPAQLYRAALAAIDRHCRTARGGRTFAQLSEAEQDEILKFLEAGDLELGDVPGKTFFTLFLDNVIEGFFCDPIYGGNRDMVGWSLVGFPGARYDYRPFLDHDGARIALEPVGLRGRPAWNVR